MKKNSLIALSLLAMSSFANAADDVPASGLEKFSAAVDGGMKSIFGWFVDLIFYSVPVNAEGTMFPLIAGWLLVAAIIFTLYFGFIQFRKSAYH